METQADQGRIYEIRPSHIERETQAFLIDRQAHAPGNSDSGCLEHSKVLCGHTRRVASFAPAPVAPVVLVNGNRAAAIARGC